MGVPLVVMNYMNMKGVKSEDEEGKVVDEVQSSMEVDQVCDSAESGDIQIDTTKSMDAMIGAIGKKRKKPFSADVDMHDESREELQGK